MATAAPATRQESSLTHFRLIYRSHSCIPQRNREAALADLLTKARSNNSSAGITGALLLTDHYFVQALEGDETAVRDLYDRIRQDHRHDQVALLETQMVAERVFSRWAMAEISKSGGADIPLDSEYDEDGTPPASASGFTREQVQVLRAMRNAIGADTL